MFPRAVWMFGMSRTTDSKLPFPMRNRELEFRHRACRARGIFAPMESLEFFRQVTVDREAGTVVRPNGVDFCPDVSHGGGHWKGDLRDGHETEADLITFGASPTPSVVHLWLQDRCRMLWLLAWTGITCWLTAPGAAEKLNGPR